MLHQSTTTPHLLVLIAVAACQLGVTLAATKVALVYNKNAQFTTSSMLKWQSFTGDVKQHEYAVRAGTVQLDADGNTSPMYVCRAQFDGIDVTGHTTVQQNAGGQTVCLVSMHAEVKTHHAFEVLLNVGHGAKLTWKRVDKSNQVLPFGAVSAASSGHVSAQQRAYTRTTDLTNVPMFAD